MDYELEGVLEKTFLETCTERIRISRYKVGNGSCAWRDGLHLRVVYVTLNTHSRSCYTGRA